MSSTVASLGMFTVLEIAPERKGWTAPIILMWPMCEIARSPTATSKTGRCSALRPGRADDRAVLGDVRLDLLDLLAACSRASRSASGTVRLAIDIVPPPTSSLYLTSEKSGSTPVVSQSIRNEIVPVGREHRRLRVAVAVELAERDRLVPRLARRGQQRRVARRSSPGSRRTRRGACA